MKNTSYSAKISASKVSIWKNKSPLLSKLDIELTERCNNNCIHCYINLPENDSSAQKKEMPTAKLKDILKEAASLGCMSVKLTGGEPLLRDDFEEIYLYTRRLGMKVLLFTNGTLLSTRLADLFTHIPPLEKIEITLYGMRKKSYEAATRTPGSFDKAWRGISLLQDKNIPFVVKGAVLPQNKGELDELEKWAAGIPWMETPPCLSLYFSFRCREDKAKNKSIESLRVTPQQGLEIVTRRSSDYLKEMKRFFSHNTISPGVELFSCGAGIRNGCVDAYGNFQLCMMLRHPKTVYDLQNGSLEDALTNFFPRVRQTTANKPDYKERCAKCFLKGFCEQCPARSWLEHGSLDSPVDYLCEVAHVQAQYLGLLKKTEKAWEIEDWEQRIEKFTQPLSNKKKKDQPCPENGLSNEVK
jgi:radical SAM protein with 4Fe4S-binding SPASM domain